jgi:hypothetical protein
MEVSQRSVAEEWQLIGVYAALASQGYGQSPALTRQNAPISANFHGGEWNNSQPS